MKMLVVLAFLVAVVTAEEAAVAKGTATNLALGDLGAPLVQLTILAFVIVGIVILIYKLVLIIDDDFKYELFGDKNKYYDPYPYHYESGYGARALQKEEESLFTRVLNSIDPVDSVFSFMEVEEEACRQRAVCELQSAASRYPLIGSFLRYLAPRFQSLDNYSDAIDVGSKRQDCTLVYAACPYSPLHGN
ncbi:uncharacterized protein LOC143019609 isoform X1 [Oratosquilla oratoria]|uniref:uncharacterized protein LOC143019609 isoform X1 n=1 Tax=Oratosquilla oratoria TaxID=337810 RepID=UPI003F76FFFE